MQKKEKDRLGRGLISSHPETGGSEGDSSEEVPCEFVEACGDPSEVLELAEEALDEIALAIDASIDGSMDEPLAGRRDMRFGPGSADQVEQSVGVVAPVGNDVAALETCQ